MKEVIRVLLNVGMVSGSLLQDMELELEVSSSTKVSVSESIKTILQSERYLKLTDRDQTFILSTAKIEAIEIVKAFRI